MNNRMPQNNQTYEKKSAMESNNMPHSNLRVDSPSGYRRFSSTVASGSAVSLVADATGVSVGVGSTVAVGEGVSVGIASVGVSSGIAVSVRATVDVMVGVPTIVGCGEAITVAEGTPEAVGVATGVEVAGVWTGED